MRLLGTMLSTSVQADRHGPSITTRSPEARTRSNRSRNGATSPPGLARIRTSACAGGKTRPYSTTARKIVFKTAVRIECAPQRVFRKSGYRFCEQNTRNLLKQSIFLRQTGFHFAGKSSVLDDGMN